MSKKQPKLSLNTRKTHIVEQTLQFWKTHKIQSSEQNRQCQNSLEKLVFDWQRLACFCTVVAGFYVIAGILSILGFLSEKQQFLILSLVAASLFGCSHYLQSHQHKLQKICGLLNAVGILFLTGAIGLMSKTPLLWSGIIGGIIGLCMRSGLTWGISLGLFGLWLCKPDDIQNALQNTETIQYTGLLFGIVTTVLLIFSKKAAKVFGKLEAFQSVFRGSIITSYLFIFLSLLSLSVINSGSGLTATAIDISSEETFILRAATLSGWSAVLAAVALGAIYCGIRNKLPITLRFGVVFLLLNILTQLVNINARYLLPLVAKIGLYKLYPLLVNLIFAGTFWGISTLSSHIDKHYKQWENQPQTKHKKA